jgi:Fe-S-cluster containining protein
MQGSQVEERLRMALAQPGQAMAAAIEILADLRPMNPAGAALVLEREADLCRLMAQGPGAAAELAAGLRDLAQAARCLGCGTCCLTSSPTLYAEDLERIGPEGLPRQALFALRPGEMVSSAREGTARPLPRELIKLRERRSLAEPAGRGCLFLEAGRCRVYQARPLQCRVLECWSGRHARELEARPRLTRAQLFAHDETALALIQEYDLKLPAAELTRALQEAAQGEAQAAARALAMLELDHNLRQGAVQRYGYPAQDLDLMWGRPALMVARAHGWEPVLNDQGQPVLRSITPSA